MCFLDSFVEVMDWLVSLPETSGIGGGSAGVDKGRTVAKLTLSMWAIEVERRVVALADEMSLDGSLYFFSCLRLLFLQKILEHSSESNYNQDMEAQALEEFCKVPIATLLEAAYDCEIRVVGAIKEIFQHKRYIVELYMGKKLVMRCMKRYSEFEALYEVLKMNFKNIDLALPEFPSKFQVLNREQTRRHYFEQLLNRIIHIYCEKITNETNRRLLSTAYVFLAGEQPKSSPLSDHNTTHSQGSLEGQEEVDRRKSEPEAEKAKQPEKEVKMQKEKAGHRRAEVMSSPSALRVKTDLKDESQQAKFRAFIACQFLVRFTGEQEWKERFLKVENSCLLIYKHKNDNNFKTKIELYQANIDYLQRDKNILDHFCEKMEFDNEATYMQDFSTLAIFHQYDYRKLLIKVKEGDKTPLALAKEVLNKASHSTANCQQIEGVFSPIGKLFIVIHKLFLESVNKKASPIVYLRISAAGLTYQTKLMNIQSSAPVAVKQGFLIPVSSAFTKLSIEVMVNLNDGIISHGSEERCVATYRLYFADFLTYPNGHGLEKIHARPQPNPNEANKYQCLLEMSVVNYSHLSSNYADSYANENDGVIMQGLKSTQDTGLLVITVDRVLRVVGNVALFITSVWRNVYLFKYPRMGYTFFSFLPLLILFGSAGLLLQILAGAVIIGMAYQWPPLHRFGTALLDAYVFKYRHQYYQQPFCIDSNELKFIKWTQNLQKMKEDFRMTEDGRLQKREEAKEKKFQSWQFKVHEKTFRIRQELPGLIEKVFEVKKIIELVLRMINAVVSTVEKVCNVFSWADPRRSLVFFLLLVLLVSVASGYLLRGIGVVFCIHRLYKGNSFYRVKHYHNNRKLAIYALRYVVNKAFPHLLPSKGAKIQATDQQEIATVLTEVFFPVRDETSVKKLREQIEFVLGVYIDDQELLKREQRKNEMRMYYLIEIIESCEARLKLEWISGQEGISEDFQQLKALTKEEPVIDLWVESLIINFFWNTPSQLYTTFRPIRSTTTLRCEKSKERIADRFQQLA